MSRTVQNWHRNYRVLCRKISGSGPNNIRMCPKVPGLVPKLSRCVWNYPDLYQNYSDLFLKLTGADTDTMLTCGQNNPDVAPKLFKCVWNWPDWNQNYPHLCLDESGTGPNLLLSVPETIQTLHQHYPNVSESVRMWYPNYLELLFRNWLSRFVFNNVWIIQ